MICNGKIYDVEPHDMSEFGRASCYLVSWMLSTHCGIDASSAGQSCKVALPHGCTGRRLWDRQSRGHAKKALKVSLSALDEMVPGTP
jgi:hypothetical protein